MHGVLMHVVQPRQIRAFKGEAGVPEIVPDLAAWRLVELVQFTGGVRVDVLEELAQVGRVSAAARNEVVVVCEGGPRLDLDRKSTRLNSSH